MGVGVPILGDDALLDQPGDVGLEREGHVVGAQAGDYLAALVARGAIRLGEGDVLSLRRGVERLDDLLVRGLRREYATSDSSAAGSSTDASGAGVVAPATCAVASVGVVEAALSALAVVPGEAVVPAVLAADGLVSSPHAVMPITATRPRPSTRSTALRESVRERVGDTRMGVLRGLVVTNPIMLIYLVGNISQQYGRKSEDPSRPSVTMTS